MMIRPTFTYEPVAARNPDAFEVEIHSAVNIGGRDDSGSFALLGWTGDLVQEFLDQYGLLIPYGAPYFTENDRVPQTRKIQLADLNYSTGNLYDTTVYKVTVGEPQGTSYPEVSPPIATNITAGVGFDIRFPVIDFIGTGGSFFNGKPQIWEAVITVNTAAGPRQLTITLTLYIIVTLNIVGEVTNTEIDYENTTIDYVWDGDAIAPVAAEIDGEAWLDGLRRFPEGVIDSGLTVILRTPFYPMYVEGGAEYDIEMRPLSMPIFNPDFPEYIGPMSIFGAMLLTVYGTKFIAQTYRPDSTQRASRHFRPPEVAHLQWAYKATPTEAANSGDVEWIYEDAGLVDFSAFATGEEWLAATLPTIPDADEDGYFSFFALVTDIWGVSGMIVIQVQAEALGLTPCFVHPRGTLFGARRSSANTEIVSMDMDVGLDGVEFISTLAGVQAFGFERDARSGDFYLFGQSSTGAAMYRSDDEGETFTELMQAFDNSYKPQGSKILHGGGILVVAKKDGKIYSRRSFDNGESWEEEVEVHDTTEGMGRLCVDQFAAAGTGTLVITDWMTIRLDSDGLGEAGSWEDNS